jgi:hypothetical protein
MTYPKRFYLFRLVPYILKLIPGPRQKKGVLVIRLMGMGDTLIFRAVLDLFPPVFQCAQEDMTILGATTWASLKDFAFKGYTVEFIDERKFVRAFWYHLKIAIRLKRRGYAKVICDQYYRRPLSSDLLVLYSQADQGYLVSPHQDSKQAPLFQWIWDHLPKTYEFVDSYEPQTHLLVGHLKFLEHWAGKKLSIPPGTLHTRSFKSPLEGQYAVFFIGASDPTRGWPEQNFIALAQRLLKEQPKLKIAFACGPTERKRYPAIEAYVKANERALDYLGNQTFEGLLDLIQGAHKIVANDTGPAHLAAFLQKPTFVILGGGTFPRFFPYPPEFSHVTPLFNHMPCYQCQWRCPYKTPEQQSYPCLEAISVEKVYEVL